MPYYKFRGLPCLLNQNKVIGIPDSPASGESNLFNRYVPPCGTWTNRYRSSGPYLSNCSYKLSSRLPPSLAGYRAICL